VGRLASKVVGEQERNGPRLKAGKKSQEAEASGKKARSGGFNACRTMNIIGKKRAGKEKTRRLRGGRTSSKSLTVAKGEETQEKEAGRMK